MRDDLGTRYAGALSASVMRDRRPWTWPRWILRFIGAVLLRLFTDCYTLQTTREHTFMSVRVMDGGLGAAIEDSTLARL